MTEVVLQGSNRAEVRAATRPRVVHVTESFASGTAAAIRDYARNYPAAEHHLVYASRSEAVVSPLEFTGFNSVTELPPGHLARIRFLRRSMAEVDRPVIVHAHSSKAGVYVRLALRGSVTPIIYTPHCYAFERLDISWPVRQSFRAVEWLLSFNTTCFAPCSPREEELSRWPISRPRVAVVPSVPPAGLVDQRARSSGLTVRIAGNGRVGKQKDPVFFAEAVMAAAKDLPDIKAVWIGGGDAELVDYLTSRGIEVTGWLPRREALGMLSTCDVYLHTALWEGFPISILEANAAGLPVIARNRPYLSGFDMPTVIDSPHQLRDALAKATGRSGDTREALSRNSDEYQRISLAALYAPYAGVV